MSGDFDRSYWEERSHYRKYADYQSALDAGKDWYRGLLRLIGRDLPTSGRHLDAGCGHGSMVHLMLERGLDAYGVDTSEWMIQQAQAATPELAHRYAVGDLAEPAPFDGPFELITCLEVVEHVPDPAAVLRNLADALGEAGTLIVSTPNPRNAFPGNDPRTSDPTHVSLHEPSWWRRALEDAGLRVIRGLTYYPVPLLWRLDARFALWIPLGPRHGPGYIALAIKPPRAASL